MPEQTLQFGSLVRRLVGGLLFGLFMAARAAVGAEPDLPTTPITQELAPGVFLYINANGSNSGFVIGTHSVALIDAQQSPADARRVLAEIRKRTSLPIRYVIITHQHSDHYFGAQVFVPPAELIAHPEVRNRYANHLEEEFKFRKALLPNLDLSEVKAVLPSVTVEGEGRIMTLHLGGKDLEIHHFGLGQTPDALFIYLPADKILFVGDVFNRKSINYMGNATSLKGWFQILERIEVMDVTIYAAGHARPASRKDIVSYRRMLNDFVESVRKALADGLSVEQAMAQITLPQYADWRNYGRFTKRNVKGLYELFSKDTKAPGS